MEAAWTRRALIASLGAFSRAEVLPTELKRFRDGATENEVVRLTDPQSASYLPPAHLRPVSRNNTVLFCSDRGSGVQAFRLDVKTGEFRPVSTAGVDVSTVSFTPADNRLIYFQTEALTLSNSSGTRPRVIYRIPSGWTRSPGFSLSSDGRYCAFFESARGVTRLRLLTLANSAAVTVAEGTSLSSVLIRPARNTLAYRVGDEMWTVDYGGKNKRRLNLAAPLGPALWSHNGRSLLYLSYPEGKLNQLREYFPDGDEDKLVAPTSQFVSFARNSNATVFAGISRNAGSPFVLLLVRSARREFTLCEHRASDPASMPIVFSPNSSRIFFQTDRHGKPVIYSMVVENLVEETQDDNLTEPRSERQPSL
jgi:oligogalacturonide lyase